MQRISWYRGLWASLWIIALSSLVNVAMSWVLHVPSTAFDFTVAVIDLGVVALATRWYFQGFAAQASLATGFAFGLIVLSMQFFLGIVLGLLYGVLRIPPIEVSEHPVIMFISIIVLTLGTTSAIAVLHKK